jgi:hypothetical protein
VKRLPPTLACLAALVVLTLGLSGCNVRFSPYAAVVNGSELSQQQMNDALASIAANAGYSCTIAAGGGSRVVGAGQGTYTSSFSAEVLSILIQDKVIRQQVAGLGLDEPPALRTAALAQIQTAFAPGTGCPGTGASIVAAFSPSYRQQLVQFQMDEDALAAHLAGTALAPGALAAYEAAHPGTTGVNCVSVIVVRTRAQAVSLQRQILAGANFASLAKAHSLDTSTAPQGGALGCVPDSEFSSPLNKDVAALPQGHVSNPIPFSSAWLLLLVTQRRPPGYTEQVNAFLGAQHTKLGNLITGLVKSASVDVDPQYGTWDTKTTSAMVKPNPGPPAHLVPNPGASTGKATSG